MISTRDLTQFPEPVTLVRLMKSIAILDAVIEPDWEYRYYSFNCKWAEGEQMASMRNGEGDAWFCVFSSAGVFLKGFAHESEMSPWNQEPSRVWPGVLECVPPAFNSFVTEPAFSMDDTTFCFWRQSEDDGWRVGKIAFPGGDDPDGSSWMLEILDGNPITYQHWAEGYYKRPLSLKAIEGIYKGTPLTPELMQDLNPSREFGSIVGEAKEIGYPVA